MTYTLVRSRRRKKTLSIQIKRDGTVLIQVPYRTPQRDIDRFFAEKKQWLQKKIAQQQERQAEKQHKTFRSGEPFLYLGKTYPLRIEDRQSRPETLTYTGREFILSSDALPGARVLFLLWYQKKAREYIAARVAHFSRVLRLSPRAVAINQARSRWGSCSADNCLTFTWRMIMAPPEVIDFIVVHELSHMKIRNHSRDYWRFMESILPGYKEQRIWLRENSHLLMI